PYICHDVICVILAKIRKLIETAKEMVNNLRRSMSLTDHDVSVLWCGWQRVAFISCITIVLHHFSLCQRYHNSHATSLSSVSIYSVS
ncbi:MAG: hypothetical protein KIG80_07910, partial [Prevotella sp.]|nr:hypothetical protein [Prevotella sp.]